MVDPGILERGDEKFGCETMGASAPIEHDCVCLSRGIWKCAPRKILKDTIWCILGSEIWQMPESHIGQEV